MARTCLVNVFHPGNVIAALSSVFAFGPARGRTADAEIVVLLHNPCATEETLGALRGFIDRMTAPFGVAPCLCVDDATMASFMDGGMFTPAGLQQFRSLVGAERVDEVHYTHDVIGGAPELAMRAYPEADHVTFGDGLGLLFNGDYHMRLYEGAPVEELVAAARRYRERRGNGQRQPEARFACLILPVDQIGDALPEKELIVVPREVALRVVERCAAGLDDLRELFAELTGSSTGPRYLCLTENVVESRMMTSENYLKFQSEMVRQHVPRGAALFIKNHPLSMSDLAETLVRELRDEYDVRLIPRELERYPVELWGELLRECSVISWSYSSLSLTYLLGGSVIHAIDDALIERYFDPLRLQSMLNSNNLVAEPLAALKTWDGTGVLWQGELPALPAES